MLRLYQPVVLAERESDSVPLSLGARTEFHRQPIGATRNFNNTPRFLPLARELIDSLSCGAAERAASARVHLNKSIRVYPYAGAWLCREIFERN